MKLDKTGLHLEFWLCFFLTAHGQKHTQAVILGQSNSCPSGFFPCNSSDTCVEQRFNCDGKADCEDRSDEWQCEDKIRKDFWNSLFKKRPDEDREKKVKDCELATVPVGCRCSSVSLFCDHQSFEVPPVSLPPNLKELDLSGNRIHVISREQFTKLSNLEILILTTAKVNFIHENGLANLPQLKKLYLSGNQISLIKNNTFLENSAMNLMVLSHNPLSLLSPASFAGLNNLEELDLRDCQLKKLPLGIFDSLTALKTLWLDGNDLSTLPNAVFQRTQRLFILSLSRNRLHSFDSSLLETLTNLRTLSLSGNKLCRLEERNFGNLTSLLKLDLNGNEIHTIHWETFWFLPKLESLDLRKNRLKRVEPDVFKGLQSLKYIYFDDFHLCSFAQHVRVCLPRGDGISSLAHLLDNVVLRVSVWIVAVVACLGNLFVLVGRILFTEPNEVHSFYIKNLSMADFLMGVYLFIIASYDTAFRGEYIKHEFAWRHSWQCNFCGFLSTLSSEASVLTLTIITIDRYTSILHPLSLKRRTISSAVVCMFTVWTIAILFSVLPVLKISYYGDEFYGNNGVCLPLHIHDPFAQAWEYSMFLFCGINMAAFAFIMFAYINMFFTITHSKIGLRSTQQLQDKTIAKRFAFIIGTDFLCWVPIILIKFIAMAGIPIQANLYAWVAIFLLPVNSALNPVLYTLTTKLFKQHLAKIVYSWRTSTHVNDSSGISLSSILHHRGSKRTLMATLSENDQSTGNRSSLLSTYRKNSQIHSSDRRKKRNSSQTVFDML